MVIKRLLTYNNRVITGFLRINEKSYVYVKISAYSIAFINTFIPISNTVQYNSISHFP